jgi:DNA mismatch repair protein MutL
MKSINILDSLTINKIAAGEVIENPASVIKELLENSIDAGSKNIFVEIRNGGKTYLRVTDDGHGISKLDERKAFMRHATSKIKKIEDLDEVLSLGFRGEALASISAVSKTKMTTKTSDEKSGHFTEIEGGSVVDQGDVGSPTGTTIIVQDLFFNVPVRKKFLKTDKSETAKVSEVIHRMAISNPDISFKYVRDDKVIFKTSGNGTLKQVVYALFGRDCARSMLSLDVIENRMHLSGLVSDSTFSKGSRSYYFVYVNGRYVSSPVIAKAAEEAYKSYIMLNQFPALFINLEINPKLIDVNIHPKKLEIKFENADEVFGLVLNAFKNLIKEQMGPSEAKLVREPKRSKASQTSELTANDILIENNIFTDINQKPKEIEQEADFKRSLDRFNTSEKKFDLDLFSINETADVALENSKNISDIKSNKDDTLKSLIEAKQEASIKSENRMKESQRAMFLGDNLTGEQKKMDLFDQLLESQPSTDSGSNNQLADSVFNENSKQEEQVEFEYLDVFGKAPRLGLSDEFEEVDEEEVKIQSFEERKKSLPNLEFKGQLFKTYILAEETETSALYIIDQHAAHERINYEKYRLEYEQEKIVLQELLTPEVIHLSNFELERVAEYSDVLERLGFDLEEFGTNSIIMRAIPMIFGKPDTGNFFKSILGNLEDIKGNLSFKLEKVMKIACTQSVKAGMKLDILEISRLLEDLSRCEDPYTCPHGRPTIVKLTKGEIEKYFKRIV